MTPGFLCAECRVVADLRSTGTPHQRGFLFLGMTGSGRFRLFAQLKIVSGERLLSGEKQNAECGKLPAFRSCLL